MKVAGFDIGGANTDLAVIDFEGDEKYNACNLTHNFTVSYNIFCPDWYIDDFSPTDDGEDDKAYFRRIISDYYTKNRE